MPIRTLNIDLETRSGADISKTGVYRYAEDKDFDILLFGVSVNRGPVEVYDLANGETVPDSILSALTDDSVIKYAYNASFERICLSYWLRKRFPINKNAKDATSRGSGRLWPSHAEEASFAENILSKNTEDDNTSFFLNPRSWRCSMVLAAYNGLPLGLEKAGAALSLDQQKMKEGKDLIRYFYCPCKPTKANCGRTWNLPIHALEKWELFKQYNKRDVEVELQIQEKLKSHPVPDSVWEEYVLDQEINDRGIRIDRELVEQAIRIDTRARTSLLETTKEKTGLDNPNSVSQLKDYLKDNGLETDTLGKKDIAKLLPTVPPSLREVLSLRLQLAKSSVKKYEAMQNSVCADGRCRGMFQFYGASRTGRWSGRLIQLQNLPQNHIKDLDAARELTKQGDYEMLNTLYPSVPQVLSELIRTAFVPEENRKFIVADFSAIEARVLAYLAREKWRIETFKEGKDIYCASASQMFRVPVEKHGQNAHLRQKGKIAELALGYGGASGALRSMGAIDMGLKEEELQPLVTAWREANPKIVEYWRKIDEAIKTVIQQRTEKTVGSISFHRTRNTLQIILPSQRKLTYIHPEITTNDYGIESVTYMGTDTQKKWSKIESYGPKFVENIVQAISRDILAEAMKRLTEHNYNIVGHIHDEVIIEAPLNTTPEEICEEMQKTPGWLSDIDLKADGYECLYYMKA